MAQKTQDFIYRINKLFKCRHEYSDNLIYSSEEAFGYSLRSGEVVMGQFYGFNDFNNKVVLDYGCGSGGKTVFYATQGPSRMIGVDLEMDNLVAQGYAAKNNIRVEFFKLNPAGMTPLSDNSVDIVISSSVIEHLLQVESALSEIKRVLKRGGFFLTAGILFVLVSEAILKTVLVCLLRICFLKRMILSRYITVRLLINTAGFRISSSDCVLKAIPIMIWIMGLILCV